MFKLNKTPPAKLTAAEIDRLKGRKLDRAVAAILFNEREPKGGGLLFSPRRYSGSMTAAWLVVEEMRRRGWFFSLEDVVEIDEYVACFHSPERMSGQAMSAEAAFAICKAALKALMEAGNAKAE